MCMNIYISFDNTILLFSLLPSSSSTILFFFLSSSTILLYSTIIVTTILLFFLLKNVKCQMLVYSGHALSYSKLVHRHATQTEGNKYSSSSSSSYCSITISKTIQSATQENQCHSSLGKCCLHFIFGRVVRTFKERREETLHSESQVVRTVLCRSSQTKRR